MIRLLGAIAGSALAIASLLLLVGIPQFRADTDDVERDVVTLPLPSTPVEIQDAVAEAVEETVAATVDAVESVIPMAPAAATEDTATTEPLVDLPANDPWDIPPLDESSPGELQPQEVPVLDTPTQWYAFWSPFRSEIAASGFVSQLQRVTGLDYRVVKIKPGVYEVAFAYGEDQEIPLNLEQITAATGLRLPEG